MMLKRRKKPNVVCEFSGRRPAGPIIDGSHEYLDALDEARLEASDETRSMTLDEIIALSNKSGVDEPKPAE